MENKIIKAIKSRVSCRSYNEKKVPISKLNEIVESGKMAPSALNRQICNILVLRSKKYVEQIRKLAIETLNRDCYYNANTLVIVYGPSDDKFTMVDGACILENMFIAANSLNINSCWINQTDELLNTPKGLKLKAKLTIPIGAKVVGTCILGYAKDPESLKSKDRKEDFIKIL